MQQHEIDTEKIEQDEKNDEIAFEAFKSDAINRMKDCFNNNGDLVDLINTLDMEFDGYDSLPNEQINEIVLSATSSILIEKGLLYDS